MAIQVRNEEGLVNVLLFDMKQLQPTLHYVVDGMSCSDGFRKGREGSFKGGARERDRFGIAGLYLEENVLGGKASEVLVGLGTGSLLWANKLMVRPWP